ncbi:MAG: ATP-dependent helicase HrpB [Hyphomicrobiaceae bacterium]
MIPGPPLPIDAVLPELCRTLAVAETVLLVAPPGAGKTTRVPLALLDAPWLGARRILVLEPRRLAARGAAERMATTLGEAVGETVGVRARLGTKVSARTRIEVVTEGVLVRMLLDDPELTGVGAILFDEFHERSLDADLGLALALDVQGALRDDLRLLVMSATLDDTRIAGFLGDASVIRADGRAYPVETRYVGRDAVRRIEDQMAETIAGALRAEPGSLLAFLPGQAEIRRVHERLSERALGADVEILPLHGGLSVGEQDRAVAAATGARRKVVLATSIAETSITIEGVRIVVDSGLSRVPRYEPATDLTRLETQRVSRASADQRRGRAGRTEPGVCYRLWDEPESASLRPFAEPEIRASDLKGLLLTIAEWGARDPSELRWLDPPGEAALAAAREGLAAIDALDGDGRITPAGRRLRALALPPRLAHMVLSAAAVGAADKAGEIAALIVERGLGGNDPDLVTRLEAFRRDRGARAHEMRRLAKGWARAAGDGAATQDVSTPGLLALAYPDRIAKSRGGDGQYLLVNGRGARLDPVSPLAREPFLVVAELQGAAAAARITLACAASEAEIIAFAGERIEVAQELTFDQQAARLKARGVRRLGAITLASEPRPVPGGEAAQRTLARGLASLGIDRLPWSKAQLQLRQRVGFLRRAEGEGWPDLSDEALAESVETWLAPFLNGPVGLSDLGAEDLTPALDALVPWDLRRRLDEAAPTHFTAPTGNRHAIDYAGPDAPALHIRVQELFGTTRHPSLAGGRLPLTLHLLSPAHRPIQITRDLPGFWSGSWAAVRADMRGRYPRHPWPEDPANAAPTHRAKPRGT